MTVPYRRQEKKLTYNAIVKALHTTDMRERLAADGAEAAGGSAKELAAFLRSEIAKRAKVVKAANLRPE